MGRHRAAARAGALARVQWRQHAQQAPALGLLGRLRPHLRDRVGEVGPRGGDGLAAEVGPLRDLVGECLGEGGRGEDGGVEERGEDFFFWVRGGCGRGGGGGVLLQYSGIAPKRPPPALWNRLARSSPWASSGDL